MVDVPVRDSFSNLVVVAALVGLAATVALSGTGIGNRMVPVAAAAAELLRSLAVRKTITATHSDG